jgi:hypothetical protein
LSGNNLGEVFAYDRVEIIRSGRFPAITNTDHLWRGD